MNLEHGTDFNEPIELTEVIKYIPHAAKGEEREPEELSFLVNVCWEDIRGIDQYPYPGEWEKYPEEKYYLILAHQTPGKCILGSYIEMRDKWKEFRTTFPSFIIETDEEG
jgi:hypothetical protein